jgi:hypothetical protein
MTSATSSTRPPRRRRTRSRTAKTWTWGGAGDPTSFYNNGAPANSTNQIQIQGTESFAKND